MKTPVGTNNPNTGNIISEITIIVTDLSIGKRVYCSGGQLNENDTEIITIKHAGKI